MKRIVLCLIAGTLAATSWALPRPTFHASYDRGLDADLAAGDPAVRPVGEPRLVEGISGQAIRVGKEIGHAAYAVEGNLNLPRGSVEMWVHAVDWKLADEVFCTFFKAFAEDGIHVYKYFKPQMLFYMITEGAEHGSAAWALGKDLPDWDERPWHHIAAVWDGGAMSFYVDGEFKAQTTGVLPKTVPEVFQVGEGAGGLGGDAQVDIDEVYVYDRPLTGAEVRAAWLRLALPTTGAWNAPEVAVPHLDLAPTVDGDLADPAWDWAAGVGGFVDRRTGRVATGGPTVLMAMVRDTLHVAWEAPLRDGRAPEVRVMLGAGEGPLPELRVDAAGAVQAPFEGAVAAARVEEGRWLGEMALPLLAAGEEGAGIPTQGRRDDVDRIEGALIGNLSFRWPDGRVASWAWAAPEDDAEMLGRITIARRRPAARLLPLAWGDESVRVGVELRGEDSWNGADLRASLLGLDGEQQTALHEPLGTIRGSHRYQATLDVPLGKPQALTMLVSVEGTDRQGATWRALQQCIPADFRRSLACELEYSRFDEELKVALRPSREEPAERAAGGVATITREGRVEPALRVQLSPTSDGSLAALADISSLEPGDYLIAGSITDEDGAALASIEQSWTCEQDGREWLRSLGVVEGVLPPWTPVELAGTVAGCWGREYDLAGGLPSRITSGGEELLAGPVALRVGDETLDLSAEARRVDDTAIEVRGRAAGALRAELDGRLEYDGLVRYQVTLTPDGAFEAEGLSLVMPLRGEHATLLNYTPMDREQAPVYEGEGSFAHGLPAGEGTVWSAGFVPFVWIGDEDVGLSWMMEDDRAFDLPEGRPAIEIVRAGGEAELRVHFRAPGESVALTEPLMVDFALQATPARPLPENWRAWRWSSARWPLLPGEEAHPEHEWTSVCVHWWTQYSDTIGWPVPREGQAVPEYARYVGARGGLLTPYMQSGSLPVLTPEGKRYAEQWCTIPKRTADNMIKCCPRSEFAEYVLWYCEHELTHLRAPAIYIDLVGTRPCVHTGHGCGYERDGEVRSSMPIFAARRMYQRLRGLFVQHGMEPLIVTSSRWKTPQYFYADSACSGEQFYHPINTDKLPYHEIVPLDQWRAEFLSPQSGTVSVFLPAWRDAAVYSRPDETRQMLALTLQHEVETWPIWCSTSPVSSTWRAKERFGMTPEVRFHPYWRDGSPVSADSAEVLVGVYSRPGAAMAVVSSRSDEDLEVTLTPDAGALGLGAGVSALDAESGETLPTDAGGTEVTVGARDFRMVIWR